MEQLTINYEREKEEKSDFAAKMLQRIKERSLVERNKRRTFGKEEGMKRWVGSSINFEEPKVDKISVKLSKKI